MANDFLPHGVCWQWDVLLLLLHSPSDLITFFAYSFIPLAVIYVYRQGNLAELYTAYPVMWKLGGAFVFFCGLSHLFSFLEIWIGGSIYYVSGVNKIIMAVTSASFAIYFWRIRRELVMIGKAIGASIGGDIKRDSEG